MRQWKQSEREREQRQRQWNAGVYPGLGHDVVRIVRMRCAMSNGQVGNEVAGARWQVLNDPVALCLFRVPLYILSRVPNAHSRCASLADHCVHVSTCPREGGEGSRAERGIQGTKRSVPTFLLLNGGPKYDSSETRFKPDGRRLILTLFNSFVSRIGTLQIPAVPGGGRSSSCRCTG